MLLLAAITYRWFGGEFSLVPECMGVRSLTALPLLAVGYAIICGLSFKRTWAVFGVSVVAAVAQNVCRLLLIHIVAIADWQFAMGAFHDFVGYVTFMPALFLVSYYADGLKRRQKDEEGGKG